MPTHLLAHHFLLHDANAVPHLGQRAFEIQLEVRKRIHDIIVGIRARSLRFRLCLGEDLIGAVLRHDGDIIPVRHLGRLILGDLDDAPGFLLRLGDDPVTLDQQLLRFLTSSGMATRIWSMRASI